MGQLRNRLSVRGCKKFVVIYWATDSVCLRGEGRPNESGRWYLFNGYITLKKAKNKSLELNRNGMTTKVCREKNKKGEKNERYDRS